MSTVRMEVGGMMCGGCRGNVEAALSGVEGVRTVEVSLEEGRAEVELEDGIEVEVLVRAVEDAGYQGRIL